MLAKYLQALTNAIYLGYPYISVTIPSKRLFVHVLIIKLKAPLVIRRVFFVTNTMDAQACVLHYSLHMNKCSLMPHLIMIIYFMCSYESYAWDKDVTWV